METFRLLIDYDVVLYVEGLPKEARKQLRLRMHEIRAAPRSYADYDERDSMGRAVRINICGLYAIKYWVDQADRQIKILDIHPADRR